ncbi:MAG: sirohydrochlorin chelatase [Actinobacteria bacterium]|nr:sirohydrochlorin chelatase [Actinomycetota bacterium]
MPDCASPRGGPPPRTPPASPRGERPPQTPPASPRGGPSPWAPAASPRASSRIAVAVAHGSADPRASATIGELAAMAAERGPAGLDLRTAFLGHAAPSLAQVLSTISSGREVTVLPLLLTAAYHSKADIPRVLSRFPGLRVSYGAPLGPHPRLLDALERRLAAAGDGASLRSDPAQTAVVLAAAGSSDPEANATVARLAACWQARTGWFAVRPAYASAASPDPAAAVTGLLRDGARRVVVATYLLAPGVFADQIRRSSLAAGAAAVSPALGACPEVADVLLGRLAEAGSARRRAA